MALLARSTGLNQYVGTGRRRRKNQEAQEKQMRRIIEGEQNRQLKARQDAMRQEVFATTEGQGIMEGADVSLGFDEDEDDLFGQGVPGLLI